MDIFAEIARLRKEGRKAALATIVQVQGSIPSYESSKILVRDDGSIVGTVGGGCVEAEVWAVAQDVMREEKPRRLHFNLNNQPEYDNGLICGGSLDIFIEQFNCSIKRLRIIEIPGNINSLAPHFLWRQAF